MFFFMPRLRVRSHVTFSGNNVMAQTAPPPGAFNGVVRPDMFKQTQNGAEHAPLLPPLDLEPSAFPYSALNTSDDYDEEMMSFAVSFTCMGTTRHIFQSKHKDFTRALLTTEQLFPQLKRVTMRKSRDVDCTSEKTPLLDLEKDTDSKPASSDYVTLDLHTGDISTNLEEKKLMDLKESLDACHDRASKLKQMQMSLDMTGEDGDVMSVEGEAGSLAMENWKRMMGFNEDFGKTKMLEDTKRRLGEARKNFSASMDKLSEELGLLKNFD
jgi:hypothetical protein